MKVRATCNRSILRSGTILIVAAVFLAANNSATRATICGPNDDLQTCIDVAVATDGILELIEGTYDIATTLKVHGTLIIMPRHPSSFVFFNSVTDPLPPNAGAKTVSGITAIEIGEFEETAQWIVVDGITFNGFGRCIEINPHSGDVGRVLTLDVTGCVFTNCHYGIRGHHNNLNGGPNTDDPHFRLTEFTAEDNIFDNIWPDNTGSQNQLCGGISILTRFDRAIVSDNDFHDVCLRAIELGTVYTTPLGEYDPTLNKTQRWHWSNMTVTDNVISDVYNNTSNLSPAFAHAIQLIGHHATIQRNRIERVITDVIDFQALDVAGIYCKVQGDSFVNSRNILIDAGGRESMIVYKSNEQEGEYTDGGGNAVLTNLAISDNTLYRTRTQDEDDYEFPDGHVGRARWGPMQTGILVNGNHVDVLGNRLYNDTTGAPGYLGILMRKGTDWEVSDNEIRESRLQYGIRLSVGDTKGLPTEMYTATDNTVASVASASVFGAGIWVIPRHTDGTDVYNVNVYGNRISDISAPDDQNRIGLLVQDRVVDGLFHYKDFNFNGPPPNEFFGEMDSGICLIEDPYDPPTDFSTCGNRREKLAMWSRDVRWAIRKLLGRWSRR